MRVAGLPNLSDHWTSELMSDQSPQQSEQDSVSKTRIRRNLLRWMPLAVLVAGLDQATKAWVTLLLVHGERIQVLPFFCLGALAQRRCCIFVFGLGRGLAKMVFHRVGAGFFGLRHLGNSAFE